MPISFDRVLTESFDRNVFFWEPYFESAVPISLGETFWVLGWVGLDGGAGRAAGGWAGLGAGLGWVLGWVGLDGGAGLAWAGWTGLAWIGLVWHAACFVVTHPRISDLFERL